MRMEEAAILGQGEETTTASIAITPAAVVNSTACA